MKHEYTLKEQEEFPRYARDRHCKKIANFPGCVPKGMTPISKSEKSLDMGNTGEQRLRIGMRTLFMVPVFVAIIASFPDTVKSVLNTVVELVAVLTPLLPAAAICLAFSRCSPRKPFCVAGSLIGACSGVFLTPMFCRSLPTLLFHGAGALGTTLHRPTMLSEAPLIASGAAVFGGLALVIGDKRGQRPLAMMLIMATAIGFACASVALYHRATELQTELSRLRSIYGELDVDDPTRVHVIRVDTDEYLEWRWRFWVPEGARYRLRSATNDIPINGYPEHGTKGGPLLEPGEHVVGYRIRHELRKSSGYWQGQLVRPGGISGATEHPWVEWSSLTSDVKGVGHSTESFTAGTRVEIIRYRVSRTPDSKTIEDLALGFLIWLEPET